MTVLRSAIRVTSDKGGHDRLHTVATLDFNGHLTRGFTRRLSDLARLRWL